MCGSRTHSASDVVDTRSFLSFQAARLLLTLDEKDPKRVFEGEALLRRMLRYKLLPEDEKRLDYVLQLTTQKLLERRLQTLVRPPLLRLCPPVSCA